MVELPALRDLREEVLDFRRGRVGETQVAREALNLGFAEAFLPSRRCTALEIFSAEEDEIITDEAPFCTRASATPKPIPEVPPMTRTRAPASFETYLPNNAAIVPRLDGIRTVAGKGQIHATSSSYYL